MNIPTFESNIVRHCNNRCVACSHGSPWAKHYVMAPETLERDLRTLARVCHADQFWLLGGEPLLHPDIIAMLDVARRSGISDQVNVLTNATLLDRVPEEFWSKINFLRISAYENLDGRMLDIARERSRQHNFGLGIDLISTFFKQFAPHPTGDSYHRCPWRDRCWTVHEGHLFLCPNAAFFPNQFMGLPDGIGGLPLDDSLTEEKLRKYLTVRDTPYEACKICEPFSVQGQWRQATSKEDWVQGSMVRGDQIECLNNWARGASCPTSNTEPSPE